MPIYKPPKTLSNEELLHTYIDDNAHAGGGAGGLGRGGLATSLR